MRPLAGRADIKAQPRGRWLADQAGALARATVLCALVLPPLAGCNGRTSLSQTVSFMFGPATEGREAPPGTGDAYPNLGTVPERPVRPPLAQRQALTSLLEQERAQAATPIGGGSARTARIGPPGFAGDRSIPLTPPTPASLGAAPPVDLAPQAPATPAVQPARPGPATPQAGPMPATPPAVPGATPAPAARPAAEAPPAVTMSPAPPPPPPPALLTPGALPPPPSPDLLAPSPRLR